MRQHSRARDKPNTPCIAEWLRVSQHRLQDSTNSFLSLRLNTLFFAQTVQLVALLWKPSTVIHKLTNYSTGISLEVYCTWFCWFPQKDARSLCKEMSLITYSYTNNFLKYARSDQGLAAKANCKLVELWGKWNEAESPWWCLAQLMTLETFPL